MANDKTEQMKAAMKSAAHMLQYIKDKGSVTDEQIQAEIDCLNAALGVPTEGRGYTSEPAIVLTDASADGNDSVSGARGRRSSAPTE